MKGSGTEEKQLAAALALLIFLLGCSLGNAWYAQRLTETITSPLEQAQRLAQENRDLQDALHDLQERCDQLQVQADEYAKIRDHIAEIEISAHRRTEEFRAQTIQQIHGLVAQQRTWCEENRVRYAELLERFSEKLDSARSILQETDLSGFSDMLSQLDALDQSLDR